MMIYAARHVLYIGGLTIDLCQRSRPQLLEHGIRWSIQRPRDGASLQIIQENWGDKGLLALL